MMISFLMLVFLLTFVFISKNVIEASNDSFEKSMDNFQELIIEEVRIAYTVENGYTRKFTIPKTIEQNYYNMSIDEGIQFTIRLKGKTYSKFLPGYVRGGFCFNRDFDPFFHHLMITKEAGIVSLSTCPDCGYSYYMCHNAQDMGFCDIMEAMSPGFRAECCDGHCKCC
jgi:hypothetical protein